MDLIILPLSKILLMAISLYTWVVVAYVVMSWLYAFGIIDPNNQFSYSVSSFLNKAVDPVLNKIRRFMPNISGLDISPIVLFFILYFLQEFIATLARKLVFGV